MTISYIIFVVIFAAAIVADIYDIRLTVAGIKKGVGVEGNSIITTLAGTDKPTWFQLLWINMLVPILPIGIPGLIFSYQNTPGAVFFSICMGFQVYSHWRGGAAWAAFIGGVNPNTYHSKWWQKLLDI
jgi:hypothetical protein